MATKSTNTFKKKERENAKRRKKIAKEAKKSERKDIRAAKQSDKDIGDDFDPDIADIVPGPQPKAYSQDE